MNKIYQNIIELIGSTPILQLNRIKQELKLEATILAKLEYFNPAGSVKDRIAKSMIQDAENKGLITPQSTIIEPTSGNTGIGLASIAAAKGYRIILTMPETMSIERRKLLKAYGAEIVLTEGSKGMKGAIEKAEELAKEIAGGIVLGQFDNYANVAAHMERTGPEIWQALDGKVDILVSGVGTGGTVTGAGGYLKGKNPDLKNVVVEPEKSPVLSGGDPGPHGIQGIGAGFIPRILNTEIYDQIIQVTDQQSYETARLLASKEGLLAGISSGAALYAAITLAKQEANKGASIVVVFPDTGERYLSTPLFE